jgi:methionine-rich copper-binding protein CopC
MMLHNPFRRSLGIMTVAALAFLLVLPATVAAHSELVSSTPAEGTTVPATFSGPIVLTFSEALASGSKADLIGPDGSTVAAATIDGPGKTMTFTLTAPLPAGAYQIKWTSIADDGDVLRLPIVHFTVAAGASTAPSTSPAASASSAPSSAPSASVSPSTSAATGASASPGPGGDTSGSSGSDVLIPIIVALIILGAGAAYLLNRRNRPSPPPR